MAPVRPRLEARATWCPFVYSWACIRLLHSFSQSEPRSKKERLLPSSEETNGDETTSNERGLWASSKKGKKRGSGSQSTEGVGCFVRHIVASLLRDRKDTAKYTYRGWSVVVGREVVWSEEDDLCVSVFPTSFRFLYVTWTSPDKRLPMTTALSTGESSWRSLLLLSIPVAVSLWIFRINFYKRRNWTSFTSGKLSSLRCISN